MNEYFSYFLVKKLHQFASPGQRLKFNVRPTFCFSGQIMIAPEQAKFVYDFINLDSKISSECISVLRITCCLSVAKVTQWHTTFKLLNVSLQRHSTDLKHGHHQAPPAAALMHFSIAASATYPVSTGPIKSLIWRYMRPRYT